MKIICNLLLTLFVASGVCNAQLVRMCTDDVEQPPYVYFQRINGQVDKTKLTGAVIDLLAEMNKSANLEYQVETVPWKRCLRETQDFSQTATFEVAFHGTLNEERLQSLYATSWIYARTGGIWYSTKKYPNGPDVQGYADLKKFQLCGLLGNNYTGYSVENELVDRNANDHTSVLAKVLKGRCDIFLSNLTTPLGKVTLGELEIPTEIKGKKIPGVAPGTFHFFIAKSSPRAPRLLAELNQALLNLEFKGIAEEIFRKHIPECGRNC